MATGGYPAAITVYSPDDRSTKRNEPSAPVVRVSTTLPAASSRVTRASSTGRPPVARTTPRRTAPPASSMSCRVSRAACTLTGRAAGRKAGALAARVYSPAISSPMTYPPSRPVRVEATTSPRTSVRVTAASWTGAPSGVRTDPARRPAPPRTTSSSTGRSPTVTLTACGWCPPAAAIRTYEPAPGTLSAYRPSSPLAPRPIWFPWTSMRVRAARGTVVPSGCWTRPWTGTPER